LSFDFRAHDETDLDDVGKLVETGSHPASARHRTRRSARQRLSSTVPGDTQGDTVTRIHPPAGRRLERAVSAEGAVADTVSDLAGPDWPWADKNDSTQQSTELPEHVEHSSAEHSSAEQNPAPERVAPHETERSVRVAALLAEMAACDDPVERKRLESAVVVEHLNVAKSIASRYRGRGVERGDLEQLAYLGLVKAVSRWLPGLSDDFLQFAVPTISGEIKRYFRDHSWLVRPPRRVQELRSAIAVAERDFQEAGELRPSDEMVSKQLGVRDVDVREARAAAGLCRPPSIDSDSGAGLFIAQQWSGGDCMGAVDDRMSLDVVLSTLSPRERTVVAMRFNEGMSQARIGEAIGVSQMQVSRILRDVVGKLRERWEA